MQGEIATLPMVPLRGLVVFPYTVINFEVARDASLEALKRAMETDQRIFLVAQKDLRIENPGLEDIYAVGCVAKVRHILKLGGGAIRVLVEGLYRARVLSCQLDGCYMATVSGCEQTIDRDEVAEAHMRALVEKFEEYGTSSGKVSPETILALSDMASPEKLVDTVAMNLLKKTEDKQEILETLDVIERYQKVLRLTTQEIQISEIEREIAAQTKLQIDKLQKEHYLREQLRAIQNSLGDGEAEAEEIGAFKTAIEGMPVPEATQKKLLKEVSRLERMNSQSPDYNVLRTYLEWVTSLPFGKYTEDNLDLAHAREVLDRDHYGMEKVKERILEFLAVMQLKNNLKGSIICFAGPPGVGKTSIARSIAEAMGRKFVRMSLGGVRDEAEIRGHRRTYIGAIPGRIASNIKLAGTMNPVFLLDEIDKMGNDFRGDPASAMLEVLDPEINSTFEDHYLDMELDLSNVLFITTANDIGNIPRPLYDRMEIIELSSYTAQEKEQIAIRHLIPKQISQHGLTPEILKFQAGAVQTMITEYTCESGVRSLERLIAEVCRKAAKNYIDGKKKIVISRRNLHNYIGAGKYKDAVLPKEDPVGSAIGLAWTAAGGTTLPIEVAVMEGSGSVELTGQLGDVMKESARTGISLVRSMAKELGIPEDFHKTKDIHIHVPEGAVSKDGPSAGITMALAVVSALTGRRVRCDVAMTGEITLTGRVLAIGGLKEKALAALAAGIRTIIIPEDNRGDIEEISKDLAHKITFKPVREFREVLQIALRDAK